MLYETLHHRYSNLLQRPLDIGFMISGGIDSTVLLYTFSMIRRDIAGRSRFQAFTIPTGTDPIAAKRVLAYIEKYFDISMDHTVIEHDQNLDSKYFVRDGVMQAGQMCDTVVLGDTNYPRFLTGGPERVQSKSLRFVQPIFDWTKREVIALAQEINMPDELMMLTNSCAIDGACGQCWECKERAWGFAVNNMDDPKLVAIAGIEPATNGV